MFYSELLSSPINSYNVKRLYGIDPVNDPARAKSIGIYPAVECVEADYSASHYVKDGEQYKAVPHPVSNTELAMVNHVRAAKVQADQVMEAFPVKDEAVAELKAGRSKK